MKRVNWKLVIVIACGLWLTLMIVASYFSYKIENWKPEPAR